MTSVVADNLFYPNGITLSADESFLLMVETVWSRIIRVWLKGPKANISQLVCMPFVGALINKLC